MRWFALMGGIGVLVSSLAGSARADGWRSGGSYSPYTPSYVAPPGCATPGTPPLATVPAAPGTGTGAAPGTGTGAAPGTGTGAAQAPAPGATDPSGSALGEAGSSAQASSAPTMIGDLLGAGGGVTSFVRSSSGSSRTIVSSNRGILASAGSFKISENESPRPQDRVFFTYNYFNTATTFGGPTFDLHRETFGFESTMLDGNASFGARLPILLKDGSGGGGIDGVGDLSVILKYAAINDHSTGNVLSGGLVVTAPTGRDLYLADGTNLHSWLIQPWLGGICNADNFYFLGFSSLVVPTETKDSTLLSTDIGIGYRAFQCNEGTITSIIPTIEGHLTDPLNHTGINNGGLTGFPDVFTLTAGVHIGLCNQADLTIAGAIPLSGPRPDDFEIIVQFNFRF
jgi:hypothetical protein